MHETEWNVSRAATRLKISRNMLRYRLTKHGIKPQRGDPPALESPAESVARPAAPPPLVEDVTLPLAGVRWERRRLTLLYAMLATPWGGRLARRPKPGERTSRRSTASEVGSRS
jgi:hypothetical protein